MRGIARNDAGKWFASVAVVRTSIIRPNGKRSDRKVARALANVLTVASGAERATTGVLARNSGSVADVANGQIGKLADCYSMLRTRA